MIAEVLNREFVETQLGDVVQMLDRTEQEVKAADKARSAADDAEVTSDHLAECRVAVKKLEATGIDTDTPANVCIARDAVASVIQSSLEAYYEEAGAVAAPPAGQGLAPTQIAITDQRLRPDYSAPTQRLGVRLDNTDARWALSFLVARGISGLRKKHAFRETPARVPIANKARLLLVGDWGSGLPRARAVSAQMRTALHGAEAQGRERHVIHLGDIYFSGFERECRNRFLQHWPVDGGLEQDIGSWCLNGNHDMFSGGYGYFDTVLGDPRFARQAGTSYFCLENDHWQIFGLDSAYDLIGLRGDKGDLYGGQAGWLALTRGATPTKKSLLLSHHQLFSAYEKGTPPMEARLDPILRSAPATAWFWGHEHLCAAYKKDEHPFVHHARLIGHGGVPVKPNSAAVPSGVVYEYRDSLKQLLQNYTRFGFAVLDFDDGQIAVKYISELGGTPHHSEVIS